MPACVSVVERSFAARRPAALALMASAVVLAGCATSGRPTEQTIRVETPGCAHASCELSNSLGTWRIERTPGEVTLRTSSDPLIVRCEADDATSAGAYAPARTATTGGGALGGAAVGGAAAGVGFGAATLAIIPPLGVTAVLFGVAVGAAGGELVERSQTGARYAEIVTVEMRCPDRAGPAPVAGPVPAGPRYGLVVRGLPLAEARAAMLVDRTAVLVTAVEAGGPAERAGLAAGDIVTAAGGADMRDASEFEQFLQALPPGAEGKLAVWRRAAVVDVTLRRPGERAP